MTRQFTGRCLHPSSSGATQRKPSPAGRRPSNGAKVPGLAEVPASSFSPASLSSLTKFDHRGSTSPCSGENIDLILSEAQPHFWAVKRHYPHYLHGIAKNGFPVWYERPGLGDSAALFKEADINQIQRQQHTPDLIYPNHACSKTPCTHSEPRSPPHRTILSTSA